MYRIEVSKEKVENKPAFFTKTHFVEKEDLVNVVWEYLKEFGEEEISFTKSMLDLQGMTIRGMNSSLCTMVKIVKLITVPPNDNEVPNWFSEIIRGQK